VDRAVYYPFITRTIPFTGEIALPQVTYRQNSKRMISMHMGFFPRRGSLAIAALLGVALTAAPVSAPKITWNLLRGLNYKTGEQTPELKKVSGSVARIPGFMVPLEDDDNHVTEFLLVPYVGACVHTPPPPPNQIVDVRMAGSKTTQINLWDPIWVEGKFEVSTVKSPYGDVSFKLTANVIEPYKD
jgi:uncharacterized protein